MQAADDAVTTRPFHETVVEAILRASSRDLQCLGRLIKATQILEGHDQIITAWNERRRQMCWGDEDLGVPANLLKKKEAAEKTTYLSQAIGR